MDWGLYKYRHLVENIFHQVVDDYLVDCEKLGKKPNTPFKGSFNVRTGPDLHRKATLAANDQSLNSFICEAIREKVDARKIEDI